MSLFSKENIENIKEKIIKKKVIELTPEKENEIRTDAIDKFIKDFDFLSLFQEEEESGILTRILPWISSIISVITLIVLLYKK